MTFGPIQLIAPGLLGLFQLKQMGRNPDQFGEVVLPGFELSDWFLRAASLDYNAQVSIPGIDLANGVTGFQGFSPNSIIVPANEWWHCENYTIVTSSLVAGDNSTMRPAYARPLVGTRQVHMIDPANTGNLAGSAADARVNVCSGEDFWVPPGSEIGIFVQVNATGATIGYTGFLRYTPCRI